MYGYVLFVVLCPQWLWRYTLPDPDFGFQKYIVAATLAGFLLSGMPGNRFRGAALMAVVGVVIFWSLCLLSSYGSIKPDQTAFFMDAIWKVVVMTVVVSRLMDSPARLRVVLWIVLVAVGWNAWEINSDYFSKGYSLINQNGWALMNANGYALVLLLIFTMGMATALTVESRVARGVALLIAVLCMHAIFIVESRGGMLGAILSVVVLVMFMPKTRLNYGILGTLFVMGMLLAGPSVIKEFSSTFEDERDVSAESRFYIWSAGMRICADYPLLGLGPWAAEYAMADYYNYELDTVGRKALHNLPLEVATGSGIPSLLGYLALFFAPLWALFRRRAYRYEKVSDPILATCTLGLLAAIPAYWFASLFNSGVLVEVPYLLAAIGIATFCLTNEEVALKQFDSLENSESAVLQNLVS
ncbi:O-Antigen ligase [Novipirellula artificiosorum]|uniref:O-Antigen ligase n=2 Tax=Novipirellula artificiosorum TaxID=2528016 RepID=A0A5C6D1R0_9BACT|nr:O-Antigen ligase [Novipirellula artificiosorum]